MADSKTQECPFEKRFPSQLVRDDAFFMSLAYNQAIDAWREDEVPIGAVIVSAGEVIGAAHNRVEGSQDLILAFADLQWHKYDAAEKQTITFGHATVSIESKPLDTVFTDDFVLTLQMPGQKPRQYYFSSSYGNGSVAVYGDLLLLKYRVGGGTQCRER